MAGQMIGMLDISYSERVALDVEYGMVNRSFLKISDTYKNI